MSKPITPTVIVGEVVAGEANKIKGQLESLILSLDKSNFDIAELCYTVKKKGYFYPFTTFQDYYKTLKLKPRKIQYLTRMAEVMDLVGIKREVYEPLGIARMREITSLDPSATWTNPVTKVETPMKEFIVGFVEAGDAVPMEQLRENVKTLKGFVGENDIVWVNFPMVRSAFNNTWEPAVELAKAKIGSVTKDDEGISQDASVGAAAETMAVAYLNDPENEAEKYSPEENEDEAEE